VFQNGTAVNALTAMAAIKKLEHVQLKRYWASETEPEHWDVQFDEDVIVENVNARDMEEAYRLARVYVDADAKDPMIIRSPASTRLDDRRQDVRRKS
jgi:hypothetical protein